MPDEKLIAEIESIFGEIIELGAASERTRLAPNLLVRNASVSGYPNYILVADDRDSDNILALKVPGVIYNTNDLVNVLFVKGGEAIAFQQGSGSSSSGIWGIVPGTSTDIFYNAGDVAIGKSVAPDARLEILDTAQAQLRLTHTEDTKYVTFTLDTNHDLTIKPTSTGQIKLQPTTDSIDFFQVLDADGGTPVLNVDATNERVGIGNAAPTTPLDVTGTVTITDDLVHAGDTDTKMSFTTDDVAFTVGNLQMLKLTEDAQDLITLGAGSGDIDIDFNGDMFLRGSDGYFGVNSAAPTNLFFVNDAENNAVAAKVLNTTTNNDAGTQFAPGALSLELDSTNNNASNTSQYVALYTTLRYKGSANLNNSNDRAVQGILLSVFNTNTGQTDWISGFYTDIRNSSTGTIDNLAIYRAVRITGTAGGTITNLYGFFIPTITPAAGTTSNAWGIYQSGSEDNYFEGRLGVGISTPAGKAHIDQASTTAAIPVLSLDQADLSEEFIDFLTTVGAGNPIDTAAIGTYYGKARVAVNGTFKYIALYNT